MFRATGRPEALSYESFSSAADQALAARGRSTLLVLENLHWCDAASLGLCARLAQSVPLVLSGLLVFSSRADVDLGAPLERIPVGPLDAESVKQFLTADRIVKGVLDATAGDPARIVALLAGELASPTARSRTLRPEAAHLLEALAVYGRPAGPDHLLALAGGVGDLSTIVAELVEAGTLEKTVVDGEMRVGFVRGSVQETTYRSLGDEHRLRLHLAVADLLTDSEDQSEARAHHLLHAEAGDAAAEAVLRAATYLSAKGEPERAVELCRRAREQVKSESLAVELDERLLDLLDGAGEYSSALPHAQRLAARRPHDPLLKRRLSHVHLGCGQLAQARAALDGVVGPCAERANVLLMSGKLDGALHEAEAALKDADDQLAPRNVLGKAHLLAGHLEAAGTAFSQNVAEAREAGRAREEAGSLLNLGMVALEQGRMDEAEQHYREGLVACGRAGDRLLMALHLQNLAVLAYRQRRYTDALDGLHEAVDSLKRLGHRSHLSWVALDLAFVYLAIDERDRARELTTFADRLAGGAGAVPSARASDLDLLRGRLLAADGNLAEASETLRKALASGAPGTDRTADAALALADLEFTAGRPEAVGAHLDAAWPPPSRLVGSFLLRRGEVALALGRASEARSLLGRAASLLSRIRDPEEGARAAHAMARACDTLGRTTEANRAREQARQAEEFLARFRPRRPGQVDARSEEPQRAAEVFTDSTRPKGRYGRIVGRHPRMIEMFALLDKLARSDATVLIRGESGTGKELVAEAIHARSARSKGRLVKVNCGALVDTLLASELFGHEKGAFTGAHERRKGLFEAADGGTLFLDEVGDVSPRAQATLLRVLQEREFERVGGTRSLRVDVRVVAATHSALDRRVEEGLFREDLYYRLKGIEVEVPALRDRKEDIPLLCEHFLSRIARERGGEPVRIAPDALEALVAYRWPGNVREMENLLRSLSVFAEGSLIRTGDLLDYTEIARPAPPSPPEPAPVVDPVGKLLEEGLPLRELKRKVEFECIRRAVRESGGNITQAAQRLGMKRPRLSQLLKEHGLGARRSH